MQAGGPGEGFEVQKYGDARVALIGFPSVGKSSLLNQLTGTESEAAAYEFTTLTCIPGVIHYKGTKIQMLDLPGIIEGAAQGKGRGRQVCRQFRLTPTSPQKQRSHGFCAPFPNCQTVLVRMQCSTPPTQPIAPNTLWWGVARSCFNRL